MQNGTKKMMDTRYTSIYDNKKPITTTREQLPADICRKEPGYRKAEQAKPVTLRGQL